MALRACQGGLMSHAIVESQSEKYTCCFVPSHLSQIDGGRYVIMEIFLIFSVQKMATKGEIEGPTTHAIK